MRFTHEDVRPAWAGEELPQWYLSFCDDEIAATIPEEEQRPGGPSWMGGCYVEAPFGLQAVTEAWAQGCNPGGTVAFMGPIPAGTVPSSHLNRLITTLEGLEFDVLG